MRPVLPVCQLGDQPWPAGYEADMTPDDDEEIATPPDVIAMLGFDPAEDQEDEDPWQALALSFDQKLGLFEFGAMDAASWKEEEHKRDEGGKFSATAKVQMKGEPKQGEEHEHAGKSGHNTESKDFYKSLGATQPGPYHSVVNHMLHKVGGLTGAEELAKTAGVSSAYTLGNHHMGKLAEALAKGDGKHGLQLIKAKGPGGAAYYGLKKWGNKSAATNKPASESEKLDTEFEQAKFNNKKVTSADLPSDFKATGTAGDWTFFKNEKNGQLLNLNKDGSWNLHNSSEGDWVSGEANEDLQEALNNPEFGNLEDLGSSENEELEDLEDDLEDPEEDLEDLESPENAEFEDKHDRNDDGTFKAGLTKVTAEKIGSQLGSNPGGTYKIFGSKAYVKFYKNPQQGRSEALASKVYEAAGLTTLQPSVMIVNGEEGLASPWKEGLQKFNKSAPKGQLGRLYAAAVVLNDWDVLGVDEDNVKMIPAMSDAPTGATKIAQTDAGGAFAFRAQGAPKPYTADIDSFKLDGNKKALFESLLNNEAFKSYALVALNNMEEEITPEIFDKSGVTDAHVLYGAYMQRIANLKKKLGGGSEEPEPSKAPPKTVAPVASAGAATAKLNEAVSAGNLAAQVLLSTPSTSTAFKQATENLLSAQSDIGKVVSDAAAEGGLTDELTQKIKPMHAALDFAKASKAQAEAKDAGLKESDKAAYSVMHKATQAKLSELKSVLAAAPAEPAGTEAPWSTKPKAKAQAAPKTEAASLVPAAVEEKINSPYYQGFRAKFGDKETRAIAMLASEGADPSAAQSLAENAKVKKFNMSPSQAWSLKYYTGGGYGVNKKIREGVTSAAGFVLTKKINEALSLLPKHEGVVYRKAGLSEAQLAKYVVGSVVEEHSFTSTSKNQGTWSGHVQYEIHSKSGRDVQWISSHKSEAEVLFATDTRFFVKSREMKNGKTHIVMEDVSEYDI